MNFAQLQNTREKQYVDMVSVVILNIGEVQQKQWPNGGVSYEQPCLCQDGPGEQKEVWSTSKFPDISLDQSDIGKPQNWKMKWFNTKNGIKICGYSLKPKQMGGPPAPAVTAPYQPQQQPVAPPAPQNTYHPVTPTHTPPQNTYRPPAQRDYDKENRGKCRFGLYQACLQAGILPGDLSTAWKLLDAIEKLVGYSMCGLPPHDEDGVQPDFVANAGRNFAQGNEMPPQTDENGEPIPY